MRNHPAGSVLTVPCLFTAVHLQLCEPTPAFVMLPWSMDANKWKEQRKHVCVIDVLLITLHENSLTYAHSKSPGLNLHPRCTFVSRWTYINTVGVRKTLGILMCG